VTTNTRMSVVQMCGAAGFSRCGYYRFLDPVKPAPADMELRNASLRMRHRAGGTG
jgi:ACT domain-containing protein